VRYFRAVAGVRRVARWARFVLGVLFLIGIVVQFLSAGYGLFADPGNFDLHEGLGFTVVHWIPILILIAGLLIWRPRPELLLSVAIGVLGFIQPILAGVGDWAGAFHPLNALLLAFLTHRLTDHDWRSLRRAELPAAGETHTQPAALS
jgi:Family of unknown function (DUF6220)